MIRSTALALCVNMLGFSGVIVDPVRDAQWHLTALRVTEAHAISTGQGVTVAVVDSGVDGNHPDLAGGLVPGVDLVSGDANSGQIDIDGHGTAMAGLIGAHGRALGIAPDAHMVSVRIMTGIVPFGSSIARGIDWAVDHDAQVISLSVGEAADDETRLAVGRAIAANIVVVAAAGNRPTDAAVVYPAAIPGVVAVAGTDRHGNPAAVSVSGPEVVLAAPAVDIVSTDRLGDGRSGYASGLGTSASTAIVAGAAALVRSKYPELTATEVIHRLTATADDLGPPGRDNEYGYGVVNLVNALTADVPAIQATTTPTSAPQEPQKGTGVRTWVLNGAVLLLILTGVGILIWRFRR